MLHIVQYSPQVTHAVEPLRPEVFRVRHNSFTQPPTAWPAARRPGVAARHGDTAQTA